MLKVAVGIAFIVAVPIVAGAWMIGTPNQAAGIITILMGAVLAMFLVGAMISYPSGTSGRAEPSPD